MIYKLSQKKKAFVDCYSPRDKAFWLNLTLNSTDYLKSIDLPNECKLYFQSVQNALLTYAPSSAPSIDHLRKEFLASIEQTWPH